MRDGEMGAGAGPTARARFVSEIKLNTVFYEWKCF